MAEEKDTLLHSIAKAEASLQEIDVAPDPALHTIPYPDSNFAATCLNY
jgi:hypothetical protein